MNSLPGESEKSFHRKKNTSMLKIAKLWVWDATLFSYWLPLLEQDCIIQWSNPWKEVTGPQIFLRLWRRYKYRASGNLWVSPSCHFRFFDSEAPTRRVDTWAKGRGGSSKTKSWVVYLITASVPFQLLTVSWLPETASEGNWKHWSLPWRAWKTLNFRRALNWDRFSLEKKQEEETQT